MTSIELAYDEANRNAHDEKRMVVVLLKNPGALPTGVSGVILVVHTLRSVRCSLFPSGYFELWVLVCRTGLGRLQNKRPFVSFVCSSDVGIS